MDLALTNKVAFIAGASRGIGLAIARAFLREGARVVITGRNAESLSQAKSICKAEADPRQVLAICGDMTSRPEIDRALEETLTTFGGLDAVIANVGSGQALGGWDLTAEDWQTVLNLNLVGSMALASASLSRLVGRGQGSLTLISSIAGIEAINAPVTYSAAKAAVQSATKTISRLVGPHGVRVNAVAPGNILFSGGSWERRLAERREFFEQMIQTEVPLRRFGQAEEVADAVIFLASDRAAFITGACLVVDGGQTRSL